MFEDPTVSYTKTPLGYSFGPENLQKDAPWRELSISVLNASKHATGDDFEALYVLTLLFNIFLQKTQLIIILRRLSSRNQAQ